MAWRNGGDGPAVGAAKGAGAAGATPLSAAPDPVTSCSATDSGPVELDGGPGGSDAVDAIAIDAGQLAGSESGSDAEPFVWVCTLCICTLASLEDGGGATGGVSGAAGATDCAASVGGGADVAGSGGWNRPGTAVVVGAAGRHSDEVGAQACIPPRPLVGRGVNPALYLAFSASESAFQFWPGAHSKGWGG